jgi:hypothetical protein
MTVVASAAALLLAAAGVFKLVSPATTAAATRDVGWPAPPAAVRLLGLGEIVVGAVAALTAWPPALFGTAVAYAAFAGFVVAARRAGAAGCGCFGTASASVPPSRRHLVVDVVAATAAATAVVTRADGLLDAGWPAAAASVVLAIGAHVVLTTAPRVRLAADRPTLVAFLSSTCLTCREWDAGLADVPDDVAVLVVERREHPAWTRFRPAGTPTGLVVTPRGDVLAEAAGVPWNEARERLLAAAATTATRPAPAPSSRHRSS